MTMIRGQWNFSDWIVMSMSFKDHKDNYLVKNNVAKICGVMLASDIKTIKKNNGSVRNNAWIMDEKSP